MNRIFNISGEEDARIPDRKYYCLVIYDISDTKRRNKLIKILKGYGERVQESCFEAALAAAKLKNLNEEIAHFFKTGDNIRIYRFRGETDVSVFGDVEIVSSQELEFI
jgi:CRISPR-associated protein Cas2